MGWRYQNMKEKLNLTETQENQIEKLRTEHQKNMVDLRAKLDKAQIEVREVLAKDDFKRSEYLAAQEKLNRIQNEIRTAAANHRMDMLDVLNKDQRKTFLEFRGKFDGPNRNYFGRGICRDGFRGPKFKNRMNYDW